jgi:hypothetical protein
MATHCKWLVHILTILVLGVCCVRLAILPEFDLLRPLALPSCACARLSMATPIECGRVAAARESCQIHLIRRALALCTSAMICIAAQLSLVSSYFRTIHSPSCLLPILQFLLQRLTRQGRPRMVIRSQMLTSATLLQSLES